ncbi:hypothetical protein GALL_531320 [mine drainage metagenome]|uniref:Uncharacterized protein n=1 Tax=mine drainage metagenome TaxID=410659 RepID=A0A1J5P2G4_9ZZZZ
MRLKAPATRSNSSGIGRVTGCAACPSPTCKAADSSVLSGGMRPNWISAAPATATMRLTMSKAATRFRGSRTKPAAGKPIQYTTLESTGVFTQSTGRGVDCQIASCPAARRGRSRPKNHATRTFGVPLASTGAASLTSSLPARSFRTDARKSAWPAASRPRSAVRSICVCATMNGAKCSMRWRCTRLRNKVQLAS